MIEMPLHNRCNMPSKIIFCLRLAMPLLLTMSSFCSMNARATDTSAPAEAVEQVRRPLFVLIFDQNCKTWCATVKPMVEALKPDFDKDVEFAQIDVTQSELKTAKQQAKALRIGGYLADTAELIPLVMIFDGNRKKFTEMVGIKEKGQYEAEIKKMLPKGK
jgi:hypothetical protein